MDEKKPKKPSISKSYRAGIRFSAGRVNRHLRRSMPPKMRLGSGADVYLAAVLEYLTAEVLEGCGIETRKQKKKRITPEILRDAVNGDEEIAQLFDTNFMTTKNMEILVAPDYGIHKKELLKTRRKRLSAARRKAKKAEGAKSVKIQKNGKKK